MRPPEPPPPSPPALSRPGSLGSDAPSSPPSPPSPEMMPTTTTAPASASASASASALAERVLFVPTSKVGYLIGYSGRTVSTFEARSGAKIDILAPNSAEHETPVAVSGAPGAVASVIRMIMELYGCSNKSSRVHLAGQGPSEGEGALLATETVEVSPEVAAALKAAEQSGGGVLQRVRQETGAEVVVNRTFEDSETAEIDITGTAETNVKAVQLLHDLLRSQHHKLAETPALPGAPPLPATKPDFFQFGLGGRSFGSRRETPGPPPPPPAVKRRFAPFSARSRRRRGRFRFGWLDESRGNGGAFGRMMFPQHKTDLNNNSPYVDTFPGSASRFVQAQTFETSIYVTAEELNSIDLAEFSEANDVRVEIDSTRVCCSSPSAKRRALSGFPRPLTRLVLSGEDGAAVLGAKADLVRVLELTASDGAQRPPRRRLRRHFPPALASPRRHDQAVDEDEGVVDFGGYYRSGQVPL